MDTFWWFRRRFHSRDGFLEPGVYRTSLDVLRGNNWRGGMVNGDDVSSMEDRGMLQSGGRLWCSAV